MSTAQSVIEKLENLLRISNNVTGLSHTDLHSAMTFLFQSHQASNRIYRGQYTVASNGGEPVILKLVHNLGQLKPFSFFMYPKGTKFPNSSGDQIYKIQLFVPSVARQGTNITYGPQNSLSAIDNAPNLSIRTMDGGGTECAHNPLWVMDADPMGAQKLSVSMWPTGFNVGLPTGLDPFITYEYLLIWGM